MKNFIKHLLLVGVAIVAVVACSSEPKREPITSDFAIYLNGYQLIEKSGVLEQITESNRLMLASTASSELSAENSEFLKSVVTDLDNSGLSLTKPAYALINFDETEEKADLVAVVEVHDAESVDRLVATLSDYLIKQGEEPLTLSREGDNRYVDLGEEDTLVGYNKSRMVVCVNRDNLKSFVDDALSSPLADLEPFEERDFALYIDNQRLMDIYEKMYAKQLAEAGIYGDAEAQKMIGYIANYRASLAERSSTILGMAFENGKIVLDSKVDGVDDEKFNWLKSASANNLKYLPKETLALINLSLNGEGLMSFVNEMFTEELIASLGMDTNEFKAGLAIATDAVSSIDGDITIALNTLDGVVYRGTPQPSNVEAIMLADVKDRYIIDNVALFGGAFLTRTADGNYTLPLSRTMRLNLGQGDNTLFAGVNATLAKQEPSAEEARWADVVKGSYGSSILVDIEQIVSTEFINDLFTLTLARMDEPADTIAEQIVTLSDYLYIRATSPTSGEIVWVFDNKNVNALRQISDIVMPYIKLFVASQM